MKILFVTENLAPFRMQWMDALAEQCDVKIMYLGHYENDINAKYRDYLPQKADAIPIGVKVGRLLIYDYKKILKEKADTIILDGYGFLAQILLIIILKLKRIPFVLSVDGGFLPAKDNALKYNLKKYIISAASFYLSTCKAMDEILCYYGANKNQIYRHHFSSVHNEDILRRPVTTAERKTLQTDILGYTPPKMIVSVGKIIYRKGFDVLIKAVSDARLTDTHLFIIGGNPSEELINLCRKNKVEDRVHFIDFVTKEQLDCYYLSADLFVLLTRNDVWGLVIGEAMAKGLPVITTDMCVAGIEMLPSKCIVKNENVEQAADVMVSILQNDELRQELAFENLNTIKQYTIETAANEDTYSFKSMLENS